MALTARLKRLYSDYEQVKKDFSLHRNIQVTPIGAEPPEKYHVTYFVNGLYRLPDGSVQMLNRHEVEITLHSDYPRYKPICRILTPIFHPNFRDGQICIGDIWGAGESLSDIIINIGNMIQYKSWNSYSPLSAEAAKWAIENKHLFPVGNADLYTGDGESESRQIELETEVPESAPADGAAMPEATVVLPNIAAPGETTVLSDQTAPLSAENAAPQEELSGNDFEITAEELQGVEFVPSAQRMQSIRTPGSAGKGGRINFKTILTKGLLWALLGALIGFGITELFSLSGNKALAAKLMGYPVLSQYYEEQQKAEALAGDVQKEFERYCKEKGIDSEAENSFSEFLGNLSSEQEALIDRYLDATASANEVLGKVANYELNSDYYSDEEIDEIFIRVGCLGSAIWSAIVALFIGLFLGIGEGVFYGSAGKAAMYGGIGAAVSVVIGLASGYLAQWLYGGALDEERSLFVYRLLQNIESEWVNDLVLSLVRGIGWSIMGLGIGLAVGLIKPGGKRILFCCLGGLAGSFLGGTLFNYVFKLIPDDIASRGVGILLMGILIGLFVGLLEQAAKEAWLKVIRGEFEGKEYLVFNGVTSIGNSGKNTIVLFKDKLIGPHHCDIVQKGNHYTIVDCGTPMGTVVNGMRITQQELRKEDVISIGNSVLVFQSR